MLRFSSAEKNLLKCFRALAANEQKTLLDFADFLAQRNTKFKLDLQPQQPCLLPKGVNETPIVAIKRLSKSYPMLNPQNLLSETTTLMSEHLLQGRDANEIINKLEDLFARHYQTYQTQLETKID